MLLLSWKLIDMCRVISMDSIITLIFIIFLLAFISYNSNNTFCNSGPLEMVSIVALQSSLEWFSMWFFLQMIMLYFAATFLF
jgi:hypothetical protein